MASGIVGLFRFPDFYTKIHAAGVIEVCGLPFCFIGLALMQSDYTSTFKLVAIAALIFLLNPVSTYALARAAMPVKLDEKGRVK
ncbi:MAG: hypothetical protein COA94_03725 [Rickettsiales bacterium]|nr:MAG: hypothetical protein COA94_03725 [Rickettsiales bacterium]